MKIIDLSHTIKPNMPVYPGTPKPIFEVCNTIRNDGFREKTISMASHTGTHLDAPFHILENGKTLDSYDVESFIGKGFVMDCREFDNKIIPLNHLKKSEIEIAKIDFLLIRTDWDKKWNKDDYFSHFPTLSQDAVKWLTNFNLKGIGLDTISLDRVEEENFPNHRIALKKGFLIIENLKNLHKLQNENFIFACLPPLLERSDGAFVRAVAIIDFAPANSL